MAKIPKATVAEEGCHPNSSAGPPILREVARLCPPGRPLPPPVPSSVRPRRGFGEPGPPARRPPATIARTPLCLLRVLVRLPDAALDLVQPEHGRLVLRFLQNHTKSREPGARASEGLPGRGQTPRKLGNARDAWTRPLEEARRRRTGERLGGKRLRHSADAGRRPRGAQAVKGSWGGRRAARGRHPGDSCPVDRGLAASSASGAVGGHAQKERPLTSGPPRGGAPVAFSELPCYSIPTSQFQKLRGAQSNGKAGSKRRPTRHGVRAGTAAADRPQRGSRGPGGTRGGGVCSCFLHPAHQSHACAHFGQFTRPSTYTAGAFFPDPIFQCRIYLGTELCLQ